MGVSLVSYGCCGIGRVVRLTWKASAGVCLSAVHTDPESAGSHMVTMEPAANIIAYFNVGDVAMVTCLDKR